MFVNWKFDLAICAWNINFKQTSTHTKLITTIIKVLSISESFVMRNVNLQPILGGMRAILFNASILHSFFHALK